MKSRENLATGRRRSRVMLLLMGLVVQTVFDAQDRARKRPREEPAHGGDAVRRQHGVQAQVSAVVAQRHRVARRTPSRSAAPPTRPHWQQLQQLIPEARTGIVLLNKDRRIVTNGTLLRDPAVIGKPLRPRRAGPT